MFLGDDLSAIGAGRPVISRGRHGGGGRRGLIPREGALCVLGSGRLLCGGHDALCAKAFGSASPLQLAKMEEFYVGALASIVLSVYVPLDALSVRALPGLATYQGTAAV